MSSPSSNPEDKNGSPKKGFLSQAWLVLLLAVLFGSSLSAVQLKLGPKIEENKLNEIFEKVPEVLLGSQAAQSKPELKITPKTIELVKHGRKKTYSVYEAQYADGKIAGFVVKGSGQGYADKIELIIGLDPKMEKTTGLFILDQKETPGLGNRISEKQWRDQFSHKSTAKRLKVVKHNASADNEIDAVTGATISSRSVTEIINNTIDDVKGQLPNILKNENKGNG